MRNAKRDDDRSSETRKYDFARRASGFDEGVGPYEVGRIDRAEFLRQRGANTTCIHHPGHFRQVEATLELIGGKWKGLVLYHLLQGTMRFDELRRKVPAVTQRMLTRQLRELETAGLILRTVYAEVPPRVEYSLTSKGESLRPVIAALREWGRNYLAALPEADRQAA